jgi:transcriptional regulator with XRE-family HTH domain
MCNLINGYICNANNILIMRERLIEFLKAENKSSAQFAEEIGVQPSGISHILSGRNNPSLDFVLKMLDKYPFISTDWLLFGTEPMYRDSKMQEFNVENPVLKDKQDTNVKKYDADQSELNFFTAEKDVKEIRPVTPVSKDNPVVEKIVWFFDNKSFKEYYPE